MLPVDQLELALPGIPRPVSERVLCHLSDADRLLALLDGRRWMHATGLRALWSAWSARRIRKAASETGGRVIACPEHGYCRTDAARPQEIRRCLASLESRRDKLAHRAQEIWTHLNRPHETGLEIHEDDATRRVHELLLTTGAWMTATMIADTAGEPRIGERKIQSIAEQSAGWIIGHPRRGYRHAWRASRKELEAAWRILIGRVNALDKRLRETRAAAHGLL